MRGLLEVTWLWQMLGTADADFYGHQTEHGSFVFGLNSGLEPYAKPQPHIR